MIFHCVDGVDGFTPEMLRIRQEIKVNTIWNVTTNQEAFDKVVEHLSGMTQRCADERMCYYRDESLGDKGRCAVGALIKDEAYDPMFENIGSVSRPQWMAYFHGTSLDRQLFFDMQELHDQPDFWDSSGFLNWTYFRIIAARYKLDDSILDRLVEEGVIKVG
jgi:hypothetical protein